ncbi:MAG: hypothetical protein K2L70_06690 [Clostridia bacterium]|nr:hypothetical protein [Clostridia bacterium]
MGYEFSEAEKELINIMRNIEMEEDSFVGIMLALTVNQDDPDGNCRQMSEYLKANPDATYDDVKVKEYEILDLYDPFADSNDEDDED